MAMAERLERHVLHCHREQQGVEQLCALPLRSWRKIPITLKTLNRRSVVRNSRVVMDRHDDHRGCKGLETRC